MLGVVSSTDHLRQSPRIGSEVGLSLRRLIAYGMKGAPSRYDLSAVAGSTRVTRSAGTSVATTATASSGTHAPPSASGSVGLTSYTTDASARDAARAPASPTAAPAIATRRDSVSTSCRRR